MIDEYKIEKGIPVPEKYARGLMATLRKMEVGDSVFAKGKKSNTLGNQTSAIKDKKFTARAVEGGCRIWRIG